MDAIDDIVDNYYNGNHDEEKEDLDESSFCTLAVTGTDPTFQAIFLCNECFLDSSPETANADGTTATATASAEALLHQAPLCVCQACAEFCHDDGYHDVEYIGMGPSYCDCSRLGNCKLYEKSLREAERLGIVQKDSRQQEQQREVVTPITQSPPEDFVREAFDISILQQVENDNTRSSLSSLLVEQARELIRHTKETHWIDETVIGTNRDGEGDASGQKKLCLLESLAWSIYLSHRERYKNTLLCDDDDNDGGVLQGGAEWWVQVKNISTSSSPVNDASVDENNTFDVDRNNGGTLRSLASSSIDLHYDKDEALAESFGIGSFPALSTVTYLTAESAIAAPTIVFDHTYNQGEDEVMSSMMVSRPRVGKHICFDGRLLHGAPYHPSLLPSSSPWSNKDDACEGTVPPPINQNRDDSREASGTPLFRVTFLVNVWNDRRPSNVHALDDKIRDSILSLPQLERISEEEGALSFLAQPGSGLPMTPLAIPRVSYEIEDDLPEALKDRIKLPFVSNLGADDDDDDVIVDEKHEGGSTVVVTFPPPPTDDCVLVTFGPGLQAYMDYNYGPEEDDSDAESNAAQADDESSHSPIPNPQSDYI
jgi:hypothetical protein